MGIIDDVKQRTDIVEVIGGYVPDLKKAGRNFRALCPFHSEKTPSFYVFTERQSWHCFGSCATGGDVFSFVMKKEGLEFAQALELLAQRAGLTVPSRKGDGGGTRRQRFEEMNRAAAEFYGSRLAEAREAEAARAYVAKRGLSREAVNDFALGYSPDSWDALRIHLGERGYGPDEMVAAGLLVRNEEGRVWDRFRNRLMFPIRSQSGALLGFGARALDDSLPKYINSPQSELFDKGAALYGIYQARDSIRKQDLAVVVEGYMDVIAAHQHGYRNVVASMGTALTERQVDVLKRLTHHVVLALDSDSAGKSATGRGIAVAAGAFDQKVVPVLTPRGMVSYENVLDAEVRVMLLPAGEDPDDVIKGGHGQWERLLEQALPVVDYTLRTATADLDLTRSDGKAEAMERLRPLLEAVKDPIRRADYVQRLARVLGVDGRFVNEALNVKKKPRAQQRRSAPLPAAVDEAVERYTLHLLLKYDRLRQAAAVLAPEHFERSENRQLFLAWRDCAGAEALRTHLAGPLADHLEELLGQRFPPLPDDKTESALLECMLRLRESWLRTMKARESSLMSDAETAIASGSPQQYDDLYLRGEATLVRELQPQAMEVDAQLGRLFALKGQRDKTGGKHDHKH